jgi:4-diphosphocytidyl-2-C-methyl-D-erythritol kinase
VHSRASAPAKVNLSLLVGPLRADGYHDLFSVFVPIDLADELDFELSARGPGAPPPGARPGGARPVGSPGDLQVRCAGVAGESNLAARALRALDRATCWALSGTVTIQKRIPMGAGLGGGSSDAAAALRAGAAALAEAGGPDLDAETLRAVARTVGADVPFFVGGRPAMARGIGDLLEPLSLPVLDIVLVFLREHLSTRRVYDTFDSLCAPEEPNAFEQRAVEAERLWRRLSHGWDAGEIPPGGVVEQIAALLENDLETASFSLLPFLQTTRQAMLDEGAPAVLMSGSGSTLFTVCRSGDEAADLARRLSARGMSARVAKTGARFERGPDLP